MGEIDPAVIKKTQETLGKIINKPQLTDALLAKPPFRFLHDIIKAVSIAKICVLRISLKKTKVVRLLMNEFLHIFANVNCRLFKLQDL